MTNSSNEKVTKTKVNWWKLAGLTIINAAITGVGGVTMGDTIGIVMQNPKSAAKLAAIGAALGASNLLFTVTKQVINEKFFESPFSGSGPQNGK